MATFDVANPVEMGPPAPLLAKERPWIMAHRGASALAPENSLAAFQLAVEDGADIIETDIWLSADDCFMCHHDQSLGRMTGDVRSVGELSVEELRTLTLRGQYAAAYPDERVPTLETLLQEMPPDIVLAIELKDPRCQQPEVAARLVEQLGERVERRTVFALSFERPLLRAIKLQAPGLPIGHITTRSPVPLPGTELLGPYAPLLRLNPWYVSMAHARGQWVAPLDPDLHRNLRRYLRLQVDAVLTNDPAATRRAIRFLRGSRA